jgi:hypothetical protein
MNEQQKITEMMKASLGEYAFQNIVLSAQMQVGQARIAELEKLLASNASEKVSARVKKDVVDG